MTIDPTHYKVQCPDCLKITSQCRCMGPKHIRLSQCDECKLKDTKKAVQDQPVNYSEQLAEVLAQDSALAGAVGVPNVFASPPIKKVRLTDPLSGINYTMDSALDLVRRVRERWSVMRLDLEYDQGDVVVMGYDTVSNLLDIVTLLVEAQRQSATAMVVSHS